MSFRLTILLLLLTQVSLCQNKYGVLGTLRNNQTTAFFFKRFGSNCLPDYSEARVTHSANYFIIGDTTCLKNNYKYYIAISPDGPRLMEAMIFKDTSKIYKGLSEVKEYTPDIVERANQGPAAYKQLLDEIESERKKQGQEEELILKKEQAEHDKIMKDSLRKLQKSLDSIYARYANQNWVLWDWSWSYSSEYSSFPDIRVEIINPFKKKMKYVWFTFHAYNAVDDMISGGIKTAKGIGPVEYGDYGSWSFDNVFFSKVIDHIRINQIKIQFFDGSYKVISKPTKMKIYDD